MNLGLAIKRVRIEKNMSQGELDEKCNISQTSISQIEHNIKRPKPKNLKTISTILNTPEIMFYVYAFEESDVPLGKEYLYSILYPAIREMIVKIATT